MISKLLRTFLLILVMLGCTVTYAQQAAGGASGGTITGHLIDVANNQPLDYATVVLLNKSTNQIAKSLQTDPQGNFKITGISNGLYQLKITFVSYLTYSRDSIHITASRHLLQLGTIRMRQAKSALKEVVVTARRSQIQIGTDKKVFSVDQSLVSQGGSATDLLANVPSVQVDVDGNVSLRGSSSVRVLINGKPSALTGASLSDILQSIPASAIENIEVINNPSAKYDAEGQSGIINIILKKNASLGFTGSATASVGNQKTTTGNLNLAYQNKSINVYANYSYRHNNRVGNGSTNKTITRASSDSTINQNQVSDQNYDFTAHNIRSGIDYNIDKNNTLSFSNNINIRNRTRYQTGGTNSYLRGFPSGFITQNNKSPGKGTNLDFNLDFDHKFKKKDEVLTANIGYSVEHGHNYDYLHNTIFNYPASYEDFYQNNDNLEHQRNLNLQADYTLPLTNGKFEAGYRTTINRNDNNYIADTSNYLLLPNYLPDADQTYDFLYKENVNALYANYQHQFGKFSFQFGLRAEDAHISSQLLGAQSSSEVPYKNNYFRIYPSLFLTEKLSESQTLQFSYSRRVSRPRGNQISPFVDRSDPLNYQQGNPELQPEDTHAFELGYVNYYKSLTLTSSLYYRLTNDNIQRLTLLPPITNAADLTTQNYITRTTYENVKSSSNAGYELIAKVSPSDVLDLTANVNVYYRHIDGFAYSNEYGSDTVAATSGWAYNGNLTATVKPFPKFSIQLRGDYQGRQAITQGYMRPMYGVDGGLRYDLTKQLSLSVNSRDIFNTRRFRSDIDYSNGSQHVTQYSDRRWSSRIVLFSASYRFGGNNRQRKRQQDQDNPGQDYPDDNAQQNNSIQNNNGGTGTGNNRGNSNGVNPK